MECTSFAALFCCPIRDHVTVLLGVVSFRISHINAGMHSLLPKRQRIDFPNNVMWFFMGNQHIQL